MSTGARLWRQWPRSILSFQSRIPQSGARSALRRYNSSISAAELQFGQPLHETHPHLLKAGELTPGITALEYDHRRSKLASKLPKNAVAIVRAAELKYKSKNVFYKYHQDTDFFYLTGFNEPGALAIIVTIANTGHPGEHTFHLYVREKDKRAELWEGARSGTQAAIDVFNADESGDIERLKDFLPDILSGASEIYTDISGAGRGRSTFSRLLSSFADPAGSTADAREEAMEKIRPLAPIITELRVFKSDAEIANMRHAGRLTGRAFTESMRQNFSTESELNAFLEYQFRLQGGDGTAFVPVVAGGQNALSIHYVRNDNVLRYGFSCFFCYVRDVIDSCSRDGELVLVDGGGEYGGYISDVTRVWPVNGKFTPAQRELYTAVLNVQRSCISLCRESAGLSLDKIHEIAERSLREQLDSIGINTSGGAMQTLFPHHVGHHIGLSVHDCGSYSRRETLRKGQCITIEPGVYVPNDDRWPEKFRGTGIRIEDSICVGDDNPIVLSPEAVKEIDDIEALR
ncbi:aminopeptidase [Microsporum audouinii]